MMGSRKDNKLRSKRRMVLLDEVAGLFERSHKHIDCCLYSLWHLILSSWTDLAFCTARPIPVD